MVRKQLVSMRTWETAGMAALALSPAACRRFALHSEISAEAQGWIEAAMLRWFGQSSGMRRT
jgi:hypothetical protein